ncbi:WbqC family protein [bacterium]|nr:WbqC family protein [candidate division CSSED10-310 bacterium]
MKRVVILQPGYLPWLGFFDQLDLAHTFVIYDDVQYDRRGWRNRNRVKTPTGPCWLTVPVEQKGAFHQTVLSTRIAAGEWRRKHLGTLARNYRPAPFFDRYYPAFEEILQEPFEFLVDLDLALIELIAAELGIVTTMVRSSGLSIQGGKTDRLVEICRYLGATHYLTGNAAHNYIDLGRFGECGIRVEFHDYVHPEYRQQFGAFLPYLSIVDLLFNHGPDSLDILSSRRTGRFEEQS